MSERKRRNPIAATLLSIFIPGLGQIYNREINRALALYTALLLLPLLLVVTGSHRRFEGAAFLAASLCLLYLFNIGDALFGALRRAETKRAPFSKWYLLLLLPLLVTDAYGMAKKEETIGVAAYRISGPSMENTLIINDFIAADTKHYRTHKPHKGDVILFLHPKKDPLIAAKRIIATEGDTIEIKDLKIFVNGTEIAEPYLKLTDRSKASDYIFLDYGPATVPEGEVFVMGDNRYNSSDSRHFGLIKTENILAKALYIYWSGNKSRIGKEIK